MGGRVKVNLVVYSAVALVAIDETDRAVQPPSHLTSSVHCESIITRSQLLVSHWRDSRR